MSREHDFIKRRWDLFWMGFLLIAIALAVAIMMLTGESLSGALLGHTGLVAAAIRRRKKLQDEYYSQAMGLLFGLEREVLSLPKQAPGRVEMIFLIDKIRNLAKKEKWGDMLLTCYDLRKAIRQWEFDSDISIQDIVAKFEEAIR